MSVIAPLLEEAWDHRRRRRRVTWVMLACAAAASAGALLIGGVSWPTAAGDGGAVAPSRVLSRAPYMGVRCGVPNSIACNRVGLAVWLRHPALSVTATIAGMSFPLDEWGDLRIAPGRPRRAFDGALTRPGIMSRLHVQPVRGTVVVQRNGRWITLNRRRMWYGWYRRVAPGAVLRLAIRERSGRTVVTHVRVGLSPGWG